jgi:endonuclease/exonuclease/phosphatase family metal-dependent hydrolase
VASVQPGLQPRDPAGGRPSPGAAAAYAVRLAGQDPAPLRLLTFNCLWRGDARERLAVLGRWLEGSDVDVACLQEVVSRGRVALLRSLAPSFPHAAWRPFALGVMGGLLTLSRVPVLGHRYAVYRRRGRWRNQGRADRLIRKGLLTAELEVSGRRLVVVNTHLLANYDEDWSPGNDYAVQQHAELGQLAETVAAVAAAAPLVVTGDLNVPSGTWLLDDFLRRTGLRDAFDGRGEPTCHPVPAGDSRYDIDHVLVRGLADVSAALCFREPVEVAGGRLLPLSDHLGIRAELRLGWPEFTDADRHLPGGTDHR